jgi:hypothetical protein
MKLTFLTQVCASAVSALAFIPICAAQNSLVGEWQGTLDANGSPVHVAWHVTAAPDGKITSTVDNIDENIYGIKVKETSLKGSDVALLVDDTVQVNGQDIPIKGDFAGTLSADGSEVNGTLTQTEPQPATVQIHFKRAATQASPAASSAVATSQSSFSMESFRGSYSGTLNDNEIDGLWTEGDSIALNFRRVPEKGAATAK